MRDDYPQAVFQDILFAVGRENIQTIIKRRTFREKFNLRVRRWASGFVNVVLLLAGMKLIVYVQDNEAALAKYFADHAQVFRRFSELLPTLVMSIIGTIIPEITKLLIAFEKWDYPEDVTKNEIWRNFIS